MALQGAFQEHVRALEEVGARTRLVRLAADLDGLDGLVIPGGESTTMTMLMERMGLFDTVRDAVLGGLPTLGTCAGMIILARQMSDGIEGQRSFAALDIDVRRNGYGRQLESFEAPVDLEGDGDAFPGVFIRAPLVEDTGTTEVIARQAGRPVGVRKGRTMALAFHPELSGDPRLHRGFLKLVKS
ncbi:MAG: pyridoxal 5'-phosphate synthase glutaminase subunit PdxT [Candidatus Dormibacteraeota bacterium]|nr:pyridoxal 5'-phosphate synthase glutaminase subunit PdxT [Candidatus Dormibacteraeota bacterium]